MENKTYVGVLGDPAKIDFYPDEFYSILNSDNSDIVFHLIGASENDVNQDMVNHMYFKFQESLNDTPFNPLAIFRKISDGKNFANRIGLFPSQRNQVINGPNFIFAPYPINSHSLYLKLKSKLTISIFKKFTSHNVLPLAYCPMGGKAAQRAKSNLVGDSEILRYFYNVRRNNWFEWFYLEAGSGEQKLEKKRIHDVLEVQAKSIKKVEFTEPLLELHHEERIIIPRSIYGGGITSRTDIDEILTPNSKPGFIPECIILGNISENDINETYRLIERVNELNEYGAMRLN